MNEILNFEKSLKTDCLFKEQANFKDKILVRRIDGDSDFHLSIANDKVFQTIMNNRSRMRYPCKLISLMFGIPFDDLLEHAEFYKEYIDREKLKSKGSIADVMIVYENTLFNIEMNGTHTLARNQDYVHRAATIKNRRGKKYEIMDYYQINLNNFRVKGHEEVMTVYRPIGLEGDLYSYQNFVNVFLLNLRDKYYNMGIESLNELERYIMCLVETSWEKTRKLAERSEILMEYVKDMEEIEYIDLPDPIDKEAEERYAEKMQAYEIGEEIGEKRGLTKGQAIGEKLGLTKGQTIGKNDAYSEIIGNMNSNGMSIEDISKTIMIPVSKVRKYLLIKEPED